MSEELEKILEELKKETLYDFGLEKNINLKDVEKKIELSDSKNIENYYSKQNIEFKDERKNLSTYNVAWSENKETLIFFMIVSVIVILIGLISSTDYIIFAGIFSFILSSVIIFITFYRYVLTVSVKASMPTGILERIEKIESKINYLMKEHQLISKQGFGSDLRDEINELKAIIKTLITSKSRK
ncbi:MAG: hypothetical protein N2Z20_04980 [Elusimicrobiales bacterium]|nr:hypothetical protein [Elusimicrobiales bacterium]